jgi:hypothetical protein
MPTAHLQRGRFVALSGATSDRFAAAGERSAVRLDHRTWRGRRTMRRRAIELGGMRVRTGDYGGFTSGISHSVARSTLRRLPLAGWTIPCGRLASGQIAASIEYTHFRECDTGGAAVRCIWHDRTSVLDCLLDLRAPRSGAGAAVRHPRRDLHQGLLAPRGPGPARLQLRGPATASRSG